MLFTLTLLNLVLLLFFIAFFASIKQQVLWFFGDFAGNPGLVIVLLFLLYVLLFIEP
ncbi:MAG: hypothetical protein ABH803_02850 [Candidatus Micrarchaeota archaeon]